MKKLLITLIFGFFFMITCTKIFAATQLNPDTSACLEIEGKILNAGDGDGACLVELIGTQNTLQSLILKDGKKKFTFQLHKNQNYTIRLSKKGYISKLICIDTRINKAYEDLYLFAFDTKMVSLVESDKLNKDLIDHPVALIYFDVRKDCFDYNKAYTAKMKKELASN